MWDNAVLLLEILLINLVLSGDNAVVIAMASRNLPERLRRRAIWWGAAGAVALRIALAAAAAALLNIPIVSVVGSLLLLYIAVHLLKEDDGERKVRESASLGMAIGIILLSDLVMSLDNVLAIASIAHRNLWLMAIGIALSIPLIVWGSGLIVKLLQRFPAVVWIGSAILGYTAGEMLADAEPVAEWLPRWGAWGRGWVPVVCLLLVLGAGALLRRSGRVRRRRKSGGT